jgi:hypothetical protein
MRLKLMHDMSLRKSRAEEIDKVKRKMGSNLHNTFCDDCSGSDQYAHMVENEREQSKRVKEGIDQMR